MIEHDRILILDFGSQYTQLIARRIREEKVYSEIHPPTQSIDWIREWGPKGIILSGGPSSEYDEGMPTTDPDLLKLGVPVLGHWDVRVQAILFEVTVLCPAQAVLHPSRGDGLLRSCSRARRCR